jgi:pimeloyl-ACP methyl ester carboxylesterase
MPFQEESLNVRGTKIQMLKGGKGDPLLYLHSAGGEVAWLPFLELLSQHYTVYLPAHPGFSQSEGLDKIDSMEDLVFHYTDLMDHLGLTRPYVAGLSLDGWLAVELASRYAHRIRKLTLLNAVGLRVPGSPIAEIFAVTPAETRNLVLHDPQSDLAKMFVPDIPSPEVL